MFNGGRGRIYASAAGVKDILNLRGVDIATYGSVKAGTVSLQSTQSGAQAGSLNNSQIGNIDGSKAKNNSKNSLFTDADSQYVENVVSLFIDS